MKTLNANSSSMDPATCDLALIVAGLKWAIPTAQHIALQNLAFGKPVSITQEKKEGDSASPRLAAVKVRTLRGIPSSIDDALPPTVIELRCHDEVLARIENLALPMGSEWPSSTKN